MRFESFRVEGVSSAGNRVTFACQENLLQVDASLLGNGSSVSWPAQFTVPCLALTAFHTDGKEARRGVKRERYREVTVALSLWDGPLASTSGVDFGDDGQAEAALVFLNHQVAAANLKWPLCSARALAARRATVPGRFRHSRILGVQGKEEFLSPFDAMPVGVVDVWAASPWGRQWPLGVEAGWAGGAEVYCVVLPDGLAWLSVDSDSTVTVTPFATMERIDLQVRWEGSGHAVGLLVQQEGGEIRELWRPYGDRESVQQLYRFTVNAWAVLRTVDETAWLEEIERLDVARAEDRLDAVSFAAAVSALARRVAGEPLPVTYPWPEDRYIRPPVVQAPVGVRPGSGVNTAQVARVGVGVGLLAAAAASMMDE